MLRADLLSAELRSTYTDHHSFHEQIVKVAGLEVDGEGWAVDASLLATVRSCSTLAELKSAAAASPDLSRSMVETRSGDLACYLVAPSGAGPTPPPMPRVVERGATRHRVFLGEYVIAERQRRLTMLRVEMEPLAGDPQARQGSLTFLELRINGHTYP